MSNKKPFPWGRMGLHWLWYYIDFALAYGAWVYGMGIEVKNWPALLGIALVGRYSFHLIQQVEYWHKARTWAEQNQEPRA